MALGTCIVRFPWLEPPGSGLDRPPSPAWKPIVRWPEQSRWISIWDRQVAFVPARLADAAQDAGGKASARALGDPRCEVHQPLRQRELPGATLPAPAPPIRPVGRTQANRAVGESWQGHPADPRFRPSAPACLAVSRPAHPPAREPWRPHVGTGDHRPRQASATCERACSSPPTTLGRPADRLPMAARSFRPAPAGLERSPFPSGSACDGGPPPRPDRRHPHLAALGWPQRLTLPLRRSGQQPPHLSAPWRPQRLSLLPPRPGALPPTAARRVDPNVSACRPPRCPASAGRPDGLAPSRGLSPRPPRIRLGWATAGSTRPTMLRRHPTRLLGRPGDDRRSPPARAPGAARCPSATAGDGAPPNPQGISTSVPRGTISKSCSTSSLRMRTQPMDSSLPMVSGWAVPWMP